MSDTGAKNWCVYSDAFGKPVKRFKCEKPAGFTKCAHYDSDETPATQIGECNYKSFGVCANTDARREAYAETELMKKLESV